MNSAGVAEASFVNSDSASFVYTAASPTVQNALSVEGTEVVGSVSNARGRLIENDGGVCYFYYIPNSPKFQSGEEITFTQVTERSGTIASVTAGSKEITDNFVFDDGQRDGYYGIAKISRKKLNSGDRGFSPCNVCDVHGTLIGEKHSKAWKEILQ